MVGGLTPNCGPPTSFDSTKLRLCPDLDGLLAGEGSSWLDSGWLVGTSSAGVNGYFTVDTARFLIAQSATNDNPVGSASTQRCARTAPPPGRSPFDQPRQLFIRRGLTHKTP